MSERAPIHTAYTLGLVALATTVGMPVALHASRLNDASARSARSDVVQNARDALTKRYPGMDSHLDSIRQGEYTRHHYETVVLASRALAGTPGLRAAISDIAEIETGRLQPDGSRELNSNADKAKLTSGLTFQLRSLALYSGSVTRIGFRAGLFGDIDAIINGTDRAEIKKLSTDPSRRAQQLATAAGQLVVRQRADSQLGGERPTAILLTDVPLTKNERAELFREAKRFDRNGIGLDPKRLQFVDVEKRIKSIKAHRRPVGKSLAALYGGRLRATSERPPRPKRSRNPGRTAAPRRQARKYRAR